MLRLNWIISFHRVSQSGHDSGRGTDACSSTMNQDGENGSGFHNGLFKLEGKFGKVCVLWGVNSLSK